MSDFLNAAKRGNVERITELIGGGANVNQKFSVSYHTGHTTQMRMDGEGGRSDP